jgi:hypothetical protein
MMGQNPLQYIDRSLVDVEFKEGRPVPQAPEVGQKIAQAKRRMDVFGVDCAKDDIGHLS